MAVHQYETYADAKRKAEALRVAYPRSNFPVWKDSPGGMWKVREPDQSESPRPPADRHGATRAGSSAPLSEWIAIGLWKYAVLPIVLFAAIATAGNGLGFWGGAEEKQAGVPAPTLATRASDKPTATQRPLEELLAHGHGGGSVVEYRAALGRAERKFAGSQQQIAACAVAGRDELKRKGVSVSVLKMLQLLDTAVPDGRTGYNCVATVTDIVLLTSR